MDYRLYRRDERQGLTFAIPLRQMAEGDEILYVPSIRVVSFAWNAPAQDYPAILPVIDQLMAQRGLRQCDTLRAAYDLGGYMGKDIPLNDTIMHIMVPFE